MKSKKIYNTDDSNVFSKVVEDMVIFTMINIEKGKLARKIYSNVGLPTADNFNHMVSNKMISNCPISVEDMSNFEEIYGPPMESIKVKSTRIKPTPVKKDDIQIKIEICNKINH